MTGVQTCALPIFIGIGYNGMPSGWTNDCEVTEYVGSDEQIPSPEEMKRLGFTGTDAGWFRTKTKPEVLHAEMNCLMKVARSTMSSEGATLFITHAPCVECAKAIYQAGISTVYYKTAYRSSDGIDFLTKSGVNVNQYEQS